MFKNIPHYLFIIICVLITTISFANIYFVYKLINDFLRSLPIDQHKNILLCIYLSLPTSNLHDPYFFYQKNLMVQKRRSRASQPTAHSTNMPTTWGSMKSWGGRTRTIRWSHYPPCPSSQPKYALPHPTQKEKLYTLVSKALSTSMPTTWGSMKSWGGHIRTTRWSHYPPCPSSQPKVPPSPPYKESKKLCNLAPAAHSTSMPTTWDSMRSWGGRTRTTRWSHYPPCPSSQPKVPPSPPYKESKKLCNLAPAAHSTSMPTTWDSMRSWGGRTRTTRWSHYPPCPSSQPKVPPSPPYKESKKLCNLAPAAHSTSMPTTWDSMRSWGGRTRTTRWSHYSPLPSSQPKYPPPPPPPQSHKEGILYA